MFWTCRSPGPAGGSSCPRTRPISSAASACSSSSTSAIVSSRRPEVPFMSEPLVVIGNGMAAARLVEELAGRALGRHAVAVVGEEPRLAYNRVLLSALLAKDVTAAEI